jgi:nitrous oxide reductase accessory protein NosL
MMCVQRTILATVSAVLLLSVLAACNRDQDQTTPVGQKPEGRSTAQEYPSTRNMENPDPAVGGTNSATTNQAPPSGSQEPPGASPSGR